MTLDKARRLDAETLAKRIGKTAARLFLKVEEKGRAAVELSTGRLHTGYRIETTGRREWGAALKLDRLGLVKAERNEALSGFTSCSSFIGRVTVLELTKKGADE